MKLLRQLKTFGMFIFLLAFWTMQLQPVSAAMVNNNDLLHNSNEQAISQISGLMHQDQVRQLLIDLGVDPDQASQRVQHMSPDELAVLHNKLEQQPAGAGLAGALLTVFIVLVITDMLGATDVFPFVKNINK